MEKSWEHQAEKGLGRKNQQSEDGKMGSRALGLLEKFCSPFANLFLAIIWHYKQDPRKGPEGPWSPVKQGRLLHLCWGWMCPCAFWLQQLLKMRNAPRTKACLWLLSLGHVCDLPWSSQSTCVVKSCLSPGQTGKAKPLDQRPGLLLGFSRGMLANIAKQKTRSVKFWQKQLLITDGPVPIQAAGCHPLGAVKGHFPAGQHLSLFLVFHGTQGCLSTHVPMLT